MKLSRRDLRRVGSAVTGAVAAAQALGCTAAPHAPPPAGPGIAPAAHPAAASAAGPDWSAIRGELELTDEHVHLACLLMASHPRVVREAIEQHRRALDANPADYVHRRWAWKCEHLDEDGEERARARGRALSRGRSGSHRAHGQHRRALPAAFDFHLGIGKAHIQARIHALASQLKRGLAGIPGVTLLTSISDELSAGIVVFRIEGKSAEDVDQALHARAVIATTTPRPPIAPRFTPGLYNTPEEIERTLAAVRAVAAA